MCHRLWSNWWHLAIILGHVTYRTVHDQPGSACRRPSKHDTPGLIQDHSNLERLTPGTGDATLATSPETFRPHSAVCLTVFLFEFWPWMFTVKLFDLEWPWIRQGVNLIRPVWFKVIPAVNAWCLVQMRSHLPCLCHPRLFGHIQQSVWRCSHMLRDITYTFWSENRVQDCAVRPVAVAVGRRKLIRPVIMATGRRSKRSKVKGHVGTAIQHSYLGRNQAALRDPDLGAARLGQDLPGAARILMLDCLFPVRILILDVHHQALWEIVDNIRDYSFGVQLPFIPLVRDCYIDICCNTVAALTSVATL